MRLQQFDHVIVRVAHMNNTGQITFARQLKMRHKHGALHISRREHPKIVQPELANGHHLRLLRHFTVTRSNLLRMRGSIVWVRANAREDHTRMRLRQFQRVFAGSEITPRINDAGNAPLKGSLNDGFTVGIETSGVNVAVAINEQEEYPFETSSSDFPGRPPGGPLPYYGFAGSFVVGGGGAVVRA